MGKIRLILIVLTVFLVGCSTEEEQSIVNNFEIPEWYRARFEKQGTDLFVEMEKHRVTFNTPDGELIDITQAEQMATTNLDFAIKFSDKLIYVRGVSGGMRFEYQYFSGGVIFYNYYTKQP